MGGPTWDEGQSWIDTLVPLGNKKQNKEMFLAVEDTLGDAFKIPARDFEDEDVKTYFYKIFRNIVKEPVDGIPP